MAARKWQVKKKTLSATLQKRWDFTLSTEQEEQKQQVQKGSDNIFGRIQTIQ